MRPDTLTRRTLGLQRSRGEYITPGPNFVWHLDGYLKLQMYGIQTYAVIDGYSRYIIWYCVGVSTKTAVSVMRQYLDTIFQPRAMRCDRGSETT